MKYQNMTDERLLYEYERANNLYERDKIESELDSRGYEFDGRASVIDKNSYPNNSTSPVSVGGFLLVLYGGACLSVLFLLMVAVVFVIKLPGEFLSELRPYFPLNESFSLETLKTKIILAGTLTPALATFPVVLIVFSLLTKRHFKVYYVSVPLYIFMSLGSFYDLYKEYPQGNATLTSAIIFCVTFIISVVPIGLLKRNWLIGLYTVIITTLGFIISGNSLITPYFVLLTGGFILIFSGGRFYGCGNKEIINSQESADAA